MNIKLYLSVLALAFVLLSFRSEDVLAQKKPTITVTTNKNSYKPGETVKMTIKFNTAKGVKIPNEPPVSVTITKGNVSGHLQDYSGGSGDYISNSKVIYTFIIPDNTSSGKLVVSGKVGFGYCNESDGICKMGKVSFSKSISVK